MDNAFVESFNGHFREECRYQHWIESLAEAQEVIEAWRVDFNEDRPPRAPQRQTPKVFLASWERSRRRRTNQSGGPI